MAEIFFYQLDDTPLAALLPDLLKRSLARGLRVAVTTAAAERVSEISALLWAHDDVAFLPHGHGDDAPAAQPVWLSAGEENCNAAAYRFYVDGMFPNQIEGLERAIILFESNSEEALASARNEWKKRKAEGHAISYWKRDAEGRWRNQA